MTFDRTRKPTSSPAAASGRSQPGSPDGQTIGRSGPQAARASRSRKPASSAELLTNGTCGPTYFDWSGPFDLESSLGNRLAARLAMLGSTESALIWRRKVTPAGHSIFRLAPWTPPTSETGCTGSPWPSQTSSVGGPEPDGATGRKLATHMVRTQWSTPRASDGEKGSPNQSFGAGGTPLPSQMHRATWVTPSTRDWKDSSGMATQRDDGRSRLDQLPRQMVATWPTPTTTDSRRGNGTIRPHDTGIPLVQRMAATANLSGPAQSGSSATTEKRGAPNPDFACWLMGFPDEWIAGVSRAMQSFRKSRRRSSKP